MNIDWRQLMRKLLIILLFSISLMPCVADNYIKVNNDMYFNTDTWWTDNINYSGCFIIKNKNGAVVEGKVFAYEAGCMISWGGNVYINKTYFFFTPNGYVKGKIPYYFDFRYNFDTADKFLLDYTLKQGVRL